METKQVETKPELKSGDTLKVFWKIKEEGKERVQPFEGILIAQKGAGISKTITVRKLGADGVAVERIFPVHSPNIEKITVTKPSQSRRAKLYYLRRK